jgi:hypothetical protein
MSTRKNLNILNKLLSKQENNQIQNYFELIISDLGDYLGLQPINKNVEIKLLSEDIEVEENTKILDLGVNRTYKNNSLIIEIYEKNRDFLPLILLREAYYCFVPKEVKDNEMIKVYINQIIENDLEKADGVRNWHILIRDILVDRDFLIAQSDKLRKFFKIEASEEHETPVQFFFGEIHENALIIGNRNITNFYDELFEKYTYKTSKSLYNEDIIKTLQKLLKIFFKNKKYVNLTDYQNLYKNLLEEKKTESNLSSKRFYNNLLWINKCTSIAPSYNIVYNAIGRSPLICELSFNPLLERNKVKRLFENLPFVDSPKIMENSFASKFAMTINLPKVYLKDLQDYFNKCKAHGYIIDERIYFFKSVKNFLNLNYYSDISNSLKIIDPLLRSYKKDYECEHLIEFPFNPPIYPLSVFEVAILNRITFLSVTGLTFDKRVETLNAIKEDIKNEYRKQQTNITDFKESFKKLLKFEQLKEEFIIFLTQNQNQGFFFLHETLSFLIKNLTLIEKILIDNPKISTADKLINFLQKNNISDVLEENLLFQDITIKKIIFNDIFPKYYQSIKSFKKEIEKIQLFYEVINSCYNLKLFNINSITSIIKNPNMITKINRTKEKRLKKAFKLAKSYKITNQKIEVTIDKFLGNTPPIIVPMLLNTIITSQFAKYYPVIFLKDTPETHKKLKNFKSYFPRVLISEVEDINTKEKLIQVLPYSVNIKEKGKLISSLFKTFKENLITTRRNFWRGIVRRSQIKAKDFYDFENKEFFYTKDFFEQVYLYSQKILGKNKLVKYEKKKKPLRSNLFWSPNHTMEDLINTERKRVSYQKINFNSNKINKLIGFRAKLENFLLDHGEFIDVKSSDFFNSYVKSIKFIPAFRKYGLAQYYLFFLPHDWNDIDLKLLFTNSFQSIKYPAQLDQNQPVFIKILFPYRTPNKSYINWLAKSKKAVQECCFFFIKKFYDITHFDHSISTAGWLYSSNLFKLHIQNVLFKPTFIPQTKNIREFNIDKYSKTGVFGLETAEFKMLSQIYNWRPLDIKSYLGTNKHSIINRITSLLRKELIFPYLSLKNLDFQDKISLILPNVKTDLKDKIIKVFSFFNMCRIYEIEGDFYIYGFKEMQSFETGFMIEIWFPKCEMDKIFDVFDFLFDYLEINHYLILTDLVNGKTLIKNAYGNLKFLEQYNPIINLKWNKKDNIWMNHKLFNEKFEPIYPDMLYGIKTDKDKYHDKDYEDD